MAYCTQQDLIDRFGEDELVQLTDRANAGVIDEAVLTQAIGDAGAEIDGYLGGRYTLPLATVPVVLKRLACDIARYNLYDEAASEQVTRRYDGAVNFLRMVARGDISLGVDATGAKADETAGMPEFDAGRSVFGGGGW